MKRSIELGGGALALGLTLAGCGVPEHTAEWYAAHPRDMAVRLEVCQHMVTRDNGCLNAEAASLILAKAAPTINPWGK